jgi:hypothetical protein
VIDFSGLSLEVIDALDKTYLKTLDEGDFENFYARNKELGRSYKIGGKQKFVDPGELFYGKDSKVLQKRPDGTWEIGVFACGPGFTENPSVVDEKTFIDKMLQLGVTQEKIDDFINYEINWDDF